MGIVESISTSLKIVTMVIIMHKKFGLSVRANIYNEYLDSHINVTDNDFFLKFSIFNFQMVNVEFKNFNLFSITDSIASAAEYIRSEISS